MYDDDNSVEYNYDEYFPTKKALWDVAENFHSQLKGEDDYIENNIILNVDEKQHMIHLTQWRSSKLKVRVRCVGSSRELIFPSGRYDWMTQPLNGGSYA